MFPDISPREVIEMDYDKDTLIRFAQVLGSHTSRLDSVDHHLRDIKNELRDLRSVVMPRRILKISVMGGGSVAAIVTAVAGYVQYLLG